jgi:hypothetical protein
MEYYNNSKKRVIPLPNEFGSFLTLFNEHTQIDLVKMVMDFLDSTYTRGDETEISSNGYISSKKVIGVKSDGEVALNISPQDLFYRLEEFLKKYLKKGKKRDDFIKQCIIDWYNEEEDIHNGILTKNLVTESKWCEDVGVLTEAMTLEQITSFYPLKSGCKRFYHYTKNHNTLTSILKEGLKTDYHGTASADVPPNEKIIWLSTKPYSSGNSVFVDLPDEFIKNNGYYGNSTTYCATSDIPLEWIYLFSFNVHQGNFVYNWFGVDNCEALLRKFEEKADALGVNVYVYCMIVINREIHNNITECFNLWLTEKMLFEDTSIHSRIQSAESETDIHPTEAEIKAENYKKGKVIINGFKISIEQPKGSVRSGTDSNGKKWSCKMNNTYGYFITNNTNNPGMGYDGDKIDVFLGNKYDSKKIFCIDQFINGKFDETKVFLLVDSKEEAEREYLKNYEKGWKNYKYITEIDEEIFKEWLYDGKQQRKPFAEYIEIKKVNEMLIKEMLKKKII